MRDFEALELVAALKNAYPRQPMSEGTQDIYAQFLADLPAEVGMVAVRRLIATSTFFPSIAEIRQLVADAVLGLPHPAEAWLLVLARRSGTTAGQPVPDDVPRLPPLVKEALDSAGGMYALRTTDNEGMFRERFHKNFSEMRSSAVADCNVALLTGERVPALTGG